MKPPRSLPVILASLALSWAGSTSTYKPDVLHELADAIGTATPVSVLVVGSIEAGFSPKDRTKTLVPRVIDSARTDIKTLSCGFTSPRMVAALLCVAKCGVTVSLVADYKNNVTDDRSGRGRAALSAPTEAGCGVRVIPAYPIHYDKVLIVDRQTIELGGFNYSDAAARVNSENVLMNWGSPVLVKTCLTHFDRNWRQSEPLRARY